jgi:hypothetical protein
MVSTVNLKTGAEKIACLDWHSSRRTASAQNDWCRYHREDAIVLPELIEADAKVIAHYSK